MGINRNPVAFELRSEVLPVALVDSSVDFLASPNPSYGITDVFTAGVQTAPAINTALADTGPLPIGAYTLQAVMFALEITTLQFEWRNAGNTANVTGQRWRINGNFDVLQFTSRFKVENANERFRP